MASQEVEIAKIKENQKTMNQTLEEFREEMRNGFADIKNDLKLCYVRKDVYTLEMDDIKSKLKNTKGIWDYIWKTAVGAIIGVLVTVMITKGLS